ncbi:MAG: DUF4019 domain-containing protein [Deltaproteobacteria bacterium]|nr:DUF4019 domain-containing protein [Deltaproteobacteria bacterium]
MTRRTLLLALCTLALACAPSGDAGDVDAATDVATEFLRALDAEPATTWRALASPLRASVPEAQWPAQIASMRAPLGDAGTRDLASALFTETLEGAPPGKYFVVEFESRFPKATCGERVTLMFEKGAWRVAGYFVRNTRTHAP